MTSSSVKRLERIRNFLKECGLKDNQIKQFSNKAINEVSNIITAGAVKYKKLDK